MATITQPQPVNLARPLGALEQFFSLVDQHRSVHFAMAAHIEGRTTLRAWRSALVALQERHPLFSVAIHEDGGRRYFRTEPDAPIPIRVVEDSGQSSWQMEVAKELATPFNPNRAPLVRAVLLRAVDETIFILTAHHSIADGLSVSYAVRDTLNALRGEELKKLPQLPAQELLFGTLQDDLQSSDCPARPAPPPETGPMKFRRLDHSLPSVDALSLGPELTSKLVARSRKERTTVHGALSSALVLAGQPASENWRNGSVRVLSPISLRRQLGIDEDCGVFVWAGIVPIEPSAHLSFWDIARYAKSELASKQIPGCIALEMAGLAQAMAGDVDVPTASQILAQGFPCEMVLTNLGRLPSCEFEETDLKLKALWGPAVLMGFQGEQTVGVTTMNGSLCLLHSSFEPLPSLLERAESILRSACEA